MTALTRRGASPLGLAVLVVLGSLAVRHAWVSLRRTTLTAEGEASLELTLIRCGLDADALAAAGALPIEVNAVATAMTSAFGQNPASLESADAAVAAARVQSDALTRKVASGLATGDEVAALANAKVALANAEAAREGVIDDLFASATADLAPAKAATLASIRANRAQDLPIEFLAKSREHTEWHALRKALSNERVCAKIGDQPDPAMQSALSTWRAEPTCASAKSALDTNGSAVKAAWDSAVGG